MQFVLSASVSPALGRCSWLSLFRASFGDLPSKLPLQATCEFPPNCELPEVTCAPAQISPRKCGLSEGTLEVMEAREDQCREPGYVASILLIHGN